jgi:hypothetical protein
MAVCYTLSFLWVRPQHNIQILYQCALIEQRGGATPDLHFPKHQKSAKEGTLLQNEGSKNRSSICETTNSLIDRTPQYQPANLVKPLIGAKLVEPAP